MVDRIPILTITPLPDRSEGIVSKFTGNGAASPYSIATQAETSFEDIIDIINPLQHIPVISSIYRAVTGDEASVGAQVAGGALYGGPIGMLFSLASAVFGELFGIGDETTDVATAAAPQEVAHNPAPPDIGKINV
ncbi:MAG: hypothetical protein AB7G06_02540 [Bdellovibrionales bacterium]